MKQIDMDALADRLRKAADKYQKDSKSATEALFNAAIRIALKEVAIAIEDELGYKRPKS
jgi:hypothetical protein